MGDGKVDLPDDLLSSKSADETWPPEDMASLEETVRKRFSFDDSRDQITSESSIPLSPQWLYTKPTESKAGLSAASMDVCTPNALPHGNSADPVQKEVWRLDGSQEKKDWRKIAPEIENNRHWREEERETGVLGRKDRRKEGERENEYCKSDRRPNNASIRETTEARLPSSDRWHDVSSRNSGHETRRDNNKWSSRWGPEYKEKGSRAEKRMDVEKEDAHTEKQPFVSSNRAASERETDSRDKWRPRHRLEAQSNGAAVYRAAPGFGLERGRVESSNIGFAPGRGKSNNLAIVSISRPSSSAGIIGAAPVDKNGSLHGNCVLSADSFLYPRGKLLDIYRKHKLLPNFDTIPEGLADVSPITQLSFIEPLAFVSPDAEEKSVLEDIRKGKIISSGVSNNRTGVADKTSTESKHGIPSSSRAQEVGESIAKVEKEKARHENVCSFDGYMKKLDERDTNPGEHENKSVATVGLMDSGGVIPAVSIRTDVSSIREPSSSPTFFEKKDGEIETSMPNGDGGVGNSEHPMFEDAESATFDIQTKLLENSYPLFDLPCLHDINSSDEQYVKSNGERTLLRSGISPEEWSLFYRDPQGEIQGPFLGADIISWFNQGFFGTDLPVRLSDVLEGAPFQELGEVMPHLKFKTQVVSGINTDNKLESSDTIKGNLEASTLAPDFTESAVMNDQQWELSEFVGSPGRHVQPRISEVEDPLEPHYGRLPSSDSGASARNLSAEGRSVHEFVMQDTEGVLFTERSGSSIGIPLGKPAGSFQTPLSNTTTHHFLANELHESSFNHMAPDDGSLHPSGRLWSDLEGTHQMCQSSDVSSGIVNEGHFINPVVGRDAPLFSHKNSFSTLADNLVVGETWTDSYRRNSFASPHAFQDTMDIHHLMRIEQEPNRCDLSEQLLSQKLQKKQVREQNILASYPSMHMNESVLEQLSSSAIPRNMNPGRQEAFSSPMQDLQHSLRVQLQQQLQQQQQQHLHQMQLQQLQQQQQESQVQQLLEQFRHHQTHDAGFGQSRVEPFRRSDMMDQVLLREKLLHELQQQSYLPARRHNPTPEQLFQAKFGQSLHRESRNDLLEHLSHSKHRKIPTLEQQILQGFQQRQLSLASRQQPRMEEERHVGGVWPVDESSQFVRAASSPHHTQSTGFSQLDFFRKQQNPSYEQSNHLRQNLALHERLQRGPYETSSLPFDRSIPLQAGAPGMNINLLIAMARVQGLDMQEQSAGQLAPFSSGASLAQPPPFLSQIDASHLNTMENRWSESKGQMPNNWIESQIYQLHLQTERQKRDSGENLTYEDPNSWASVVKNDGYSKRGSMDFLHKIQGLPSTQSLEMGNRAPKSSYERREHTLFSQSDSEHSFNLVTDKVGLDCPFPEGPHHLNIRRGMQDWMLNVGMEEQVSGIESGERLIYRSNSQALIEEQYFPGMNKRAQEAYANSDMFGEHSVDSIDLLEAKNWKERKCGAKSKLDNKILSEVQESMVEQSVVGATNCGELLVDAPSRHTSLDNAGRNLNLGLDNFEMGVDNAYGGEEMAKEKISTISSIGNDNSMMKRSHVESILSTQEALHGLASAPTAKGKNMVNLAFSDEGRQAPAVRENPATRVSETMVSDEKEMLFHQYSACNDEDVSETSLTGTLKSTTKPVLEDDATIGISESSVAAQGGRSSKRKGKKGRQFDPALLGFTVSSSRSMGEIQRPDDY